MDKFVINTDGGARGNPGSAGAGVVISDASGRVIKEAQRALGVTTNNVAEYQAVILGLETFKKSLGKTVAKQAEIEFRLDSELVVKQLTGLYQIKEPDLYPFFIKIWNLRVADFPHLSFIHIPREDNRRADQLANLAMDDNPRLPL